MAGLSSVPSPSKPYRMWFCVFPSRPGPIRSGVTMTEGAGTALHPGEKSVAANRNLFTGDILQLTSLRRMTALR